MRYHALACDYDGTIAWNGRVDNDTLAALRRVKDSGRKLLLVTGRELDDLQRVFDHIEIFDRVVAENGALLYRPATREEKALAERPPKQFCDELIARGAERVSVGRVIVATWEPHETTALELIREMGLELQVVFNKGAVMILPSGINKAVGLTHALAELGLSPHNVVGVGDAENDHAFLSLAECGAAVSNALDMLKHRADWVASQSHGAGVAELIGQMLENDLAPLEEKLHHRLVLGRDAAGNDFTLKPYGLNVLVCGTSGAGKSTLATTMMESLAELQYQFLIVDPEGDYSSFEKAVVLGDNKRPPSVQEVLDLLVKVDQNAAVNLIGLELKERPLFFESLLPQIQGMRNKTGRPHWMLVDEAHHVLPSSWDLAGLTLPLQGVALITLEPNRVSPEILSTMDLIVVIGDSPDDMFRTFASAVGAEPPTEYGMPLEKGEALAWFWKTSKDPAWFRINKPVSERRRHRRKYAEGELPPERSFYFKGRSQKLNLRAQNLQTFLQMAEGVDDDTWMYHLTAGDFAVWFTRVIKDPELGAVAESLQRDASVTPAQSREVIRKEIEQRYILAA